MKFFETELWQNNSDLGFEQKKKKKVCHIFLFSLISFFFFFLILSKTNDCIRQ